jgi:hypothetical protein
MIFEALELGKIDFIGIAIDITNFDGSGFWLASESKRPVEVS